MHRATHTSLFILVDALGWDYLRDRPFLEGIAQYRGELTTILGFSSAAIPAILTGALPSVNGHWNLFYYDPEGSPFRWARPLAVLPSFLLNNRISRKLINWTAHKLMGYEGYFYLYAVPVELLPYFNYCEKRDIFRPGGINRGRSIFDLLEERSIPFRSYSYHQYTDQEIIRAAIHDVEQGAAQFYFLYLSEMDMFLHRHCQEPEKVDAKVALYDRWLRQLYERALAAGGDIVMYVFSDHGMVPTTSTRDLWSEIEHLGFKVPRDYLPFYDSTMARFWFFSTAARDRITSYLSSLDCGHILTSEERQEFGVDFPDGRFGEAVFLMNPGCLTVPSYLGKGTLKGMHGFHPSAPFSSGALVSTVELPMPVRTLTDVYRLMELAVY